MKKLAALLLVIVIGVLLFINLYGNQNITDLLVDGNTFSEVNNRVSRSYIDKNVTGENNGVVFGESKDLESGSANIVTSIIVNYRSFDTLGEVTVLFVSALGVALLLGGASNKFRFTTEPNFILRTGARLVFGFIIINGVFMFIHGHLTPGGGFPGGSMIAAAFLLLYISDEDFRVKVKALKVTEGFAGSLYVIIGLVSMAFGYYFLENFIPTGVVGELFSAGFIPIVYILIGLKVGSELSGIIENFLSEEVVE